VFLSIPNGWGLVMARNGVIADKELALSTSTGLG